MPIRAIRGRLGLRFPGSVLFARLDFAEDGFRRDVGLGCVEFGGIRARDAEFFRDGGVERGQLVELVPGEEADVQVEVGAFVGFRSETVLGDENEGGKKDGFDRRDHGEDD